MTFSMENLRLYAESFLGYCRISVNLASLLFPSKSFLELMQNEQDDNDSPLLEVIQPSTMSFDVLFDILVLNSAPVKIIPFLRLFIETYLRLIKAKTWSGCIPKNEVDETHHGCWRKSVVLVRELPCATF